MIKVFYWAPFISKIATPIAVINSAISLKKYSKGTIEPTIISLFNEWSDYQKNYQRFIHKCFILGTISQFKQ